MNIPLINDIKDGLVPIINRQYISRITKLPLNPNFNYVDHKQMDSYDLMVVDDEFDFPNIHLFALYMDNSIHISTTEKGLKFTSLQEIVCLVAKWFTQIS